MDLRASLFTDHRRVILFFAFNFRGWSRQRKYFNSEIFPIYGILVNALVVLVFACYCSSVVNCTKFNIEGADSMISCEAVGHVCEACKENFVFSHK